MQKLYKKGFISIELILISAMILIFAAWMLFDRYPTYISETSNAIEQETTRFDKLPDGVSRIEG